MAHRGKTTRIILPAAGVLLLAACAFVALAWARGHGDADATPRYAIDQNRVMGTLEKVDASSRTIILRLEDGERRTMRYDAKTFFLVDGKMASPSTLRRGEQAAVVPGDKADAVEYLTQGAWQCAPGGKLPRSKDPRTLQCPPGRQ